MNTVQQSDVQNLHTYNNQKFKMCDLHIQLLRIHPLASSCHDTFTPSIYVSSFCHDQVQRCLQMFLGVAPGLDTSTDAGMERLGNLFREQLQIHPDQLTDSQKAAAQGFQNAFTEQLGLVLLVRFNSFCGEHPVHGAVCACDNLLDTSLWQSTVVGLAVLMCTVKHYDHNQRHGTRLVPCDTLSSALRYTLKGRSHPEAEL
jgi:hypothetical protein